MANEVTINIESSLAAMAFVVADQQEQIKTLRELNMEWDKLYKDEQLINNTHRATIGGLEDEIKELKEKLHESEQDAKNYKDNVDVLDDENVDLCKRINKLKGKILDWHEIEDYDIPLQGYKLPFSTEDCPQAPCILLKIEYIKDGCFDNVNHPIPVSAQNVVFAYPCIEKGRYTLNHNDTYTKAIAWCVVSDKNF